MKFLDTIRYSEWWAYKLCPLLGIAYATMLMGETDFARTGLLLAFLLFSIANGAAYVCIINDLTDIKEDLLCGKPNRMAKVSGPWRWILPVFCLLIGAPFLYLLYPDWLSMALYPLPCIAFSLYSFEPFRLKRRGFWGVLADASGSHLFPSLYFVAALSHFTGQAVNWFWFSAVGVWALCYGLRGILWHQFRDRDNDLRAGLHTFASSRDPEKYAGYGWRIFLPEAAALAAMLAIIGEPLCILLLPAYAVVVLFRYKMLGQRPILIRTPSEGRFQIVMMDYYQVFLPVALLCIAVARDTGAAWVLMVHLLLFPRKIGDVIKDMFRAVRRWMMRRSGPEFSGGPADQRGIYPQGHGEASAEIRVIRGSSFPLIPLINAEFTHKATAKHPRRSAPSAGALSR